MESQNKKNRMCNFINCNSRASFNYPNEKQVIYCNQHKLENMINVNNKKCIFNNCILKATFNYPNENKSIYCRQHKLENMTDNGHSKCIQQNCNVRPLYNYQDYKIPIYCNQHKLNNMIDISHNKCIFKNCSVRATFNVSNKSKAIYCSQHKQENMVDVINKKCLTLYCDKQIFNKLYKGYCFRCFVHLYPDQPNSRNYKTKELLVQDFIKNSFTGEELKIQYDKNIQNGCSLRRPDVLIDCGTHIIDLEINEQHHKYYDNLCEQKRLCQIYQDCGYMNVIQINFNPDSYTNTDNQNIKGCFKVNKQGVCVVQNQKEWQLRLDILKESISRHIKNIPEKALTIDYLFY